ncbi:MAG: hypothetical protein K2W96_16235 [Gemmataceae bacterium]|nr:hypothetical protein [Gemmataceae bacterium]
MVRSLEVAELEEWLRQDTVGSCFVYESAPGTAGHEGDSRERAHALFVRVLARLTLGLGLTPTYPAPAAGDRRVSLGLAGGLVAVWDFDYYQLSISVTDRGSDDCIVVIARHANR